jgi:SOS response regulatory protein OraA/RecX
VHSEETAKQFETFWRSYPKRQGSNPKKPAAVKFEAAVKRGIDPAIIVRGAENYAADVAREGTAPRFVAQAITWLNQERWADHQEIQEARLRAGMC